MTYRLLQRLTERKRTRSLPVFKRILILRPDRLGDVLLTFPAIYNIAKSFPGAEIYYLCRQYTAPIVRCYTPVRKTILFPEQKDKSAFRKLTSELSAMQFDLAVHLLPKASLARATYASGIPYRLGMGYRLYSIFYNLRQFEHRKYNDYHEAAYNLRMLRLLGISTDYDAGSYDPFRFPASVEETVDQLIDLRIGKGDYMVIHPASGGSSIDWPLENFITLARIVIKWNRMPVVITGVASERARLDPLLKSGLPCIDLTGQLDLVQLAVLLKRAALFLSNSTGPLHLAVAMGTPVLGFYPAAFDLGPKRWGPFMRDDLQVITPNDHLPPESRPSSNLDMTKITPEKAFERIKAILNR